MRIHDLTSRLAACGAQPCHSRRILRAWLAGLTLDSGPRNRPAAGPVTTTHMAPDDGGDVASLDHLFDPGEESGDD